MNGFISSPQVRALQYYVWKPPVDVIVSGIGKLRINPNFKGYGKSALFQTHSLLSASNQG